MSDAVANLAVAAKMTGYRLYIVSGAGGSLRQLPVGRPLSPSGTLLFKQAVKLLNELIRSHRHLQTVAFIDGVAKLPRWLCMRVNGGSQLAELRMLLTDHPGQLEPPT